ncbi:crotonobetainyl-CoA:carnitine CoA-transferase CaiB-like acyl-CoA transferase [Cupriavidus gilardii J11]|uniref:Crotonobetainyl-CoA:carnitine CoA-transferase CaiB-like acyl-CoA transferase n=1 Tax=Cupriavidus gilardii J11 TaxID=936133 RepID=A0A562BPK8_9BURK|nr:CoA transferase [Cupriavidus gilardii]TWG87218.1 crotonobetainyl-CoA:carnitine CoA-transferase CaiB-like acyl-CoA transferase [Cupriavidus gilardii J11]
MNASSSHTAVDGTANATGPLAGIRVIDMTSVGMGPYATQILGDMGAEVIKVESPDGDVFRHAEPARHAGMGAAFLNLNRNKRIVTLDLKRDDDLLTLKRWIAEADVFISNVRPASLRKLGLDDASLRATNPRLIYCGAYGYAESGPYAGQPAFDDIIQARSGMAQFQGANSDEGPRYVNTILADKVAGLTVAYAIPMALYERERSGLGQAIEVPMFETLVSFLAVEQLAGRTFEPALGGTGYGRVMSPHRKPYRTQDGHIALLPYTSAQWARFFALAGRPDLASDPRYADPAGRSANIDSLYATLADIMQARTTAQWLDLLRDADIPHGEVPHYDEVLDDPHLRATGMVFEYDHPTEGRLRAVGIPTAFSRTPGNIRRWPQPLPPRGVPAADSDEP